MNKPIPDTDPLKREQPGAISKVPNSDVGESGRSTGRRGKEGLPRTGDKHRPDPYNGRASTQTPQEQNRPEHQNK